MAATDLHYLSLDEVARRLKARKLSSVEATRAILDRNLHAHLVDALDLCRDVLDEAEVDAIVSTPAKRFTTYLQQYAVVLGGSIAHA